MTMMRPVSGWIANWMLLQPPVSDGADDGDADVAQALHLAVGGQSRATVIESPAHADRVDVFRLNTTTICPPCRA